MPSTTCGPGSESSKDFVPPFQQPMQFDEQLFYPLAPSPYRVPPGCYNSVQAYPTDPPTSAVDLYATQPNPTESPHYFDMPHIPQFPLPRNLYFFDDQSLEESELSWSRQNLVQAQRLPQTSDGPQPIVYRRIAQRSYDDFQGSLPPNVPNMTRVPSHPTIGVSSSNTAHLAEMSGEHFTPLDAHNVYVDHTPVQYAETVPVPTQNNYPRDAIVPQMCVYLYYAMLILELNRGVQHNVS